MKIKAVIFVALILWFWNPGSVLADSLLYQENFDGSAVGWQGYAKHPGQWGWVATGGFVGGAFHQLYPASATWGRDNFAILEGKNWTDFSFTAKIKIKKVASSTKPEGNSAGISARMSVNNIKADNPSVGGYRCVLSDNGNLWLQRYRLAQPSGYVGDYRNPLSLKSVGFLYQENKWYTLKMEFAGNVIRCLVDGGLKAEYTDTNSLTPDEISAGITQNNAIFKSGTIGLVAYGAEVWWDEIEVRGSGTDNNQKLQELLKNWGITNEVDLTILLNNWQS